MALPRTVAPPARRGRAAPARRSASARLVALASLVAAACGGGDRDYPAIATRLIADKTAALLELGPLQPSCEAPARQDVGTEFPCTATTEDGRTVRLVATIAVDGELDVTATNVILGADVERIESRAVEILQQQTDLVVERADFDCGATSVIIDVTREVVACTYTDPADGAVHDATIDIADLADLDTFSVEVADDPRP